MNALFFIIKNMSYNVICCQNHWNARNSFICELYWTFIWMNTSTSLQCRKGLWNTISTSRVLPVLESLLILGQPVISLCSHWLSQVSESIGIGEIKFLEDVLKRVLYTVLQNTAGLKTVPKASVHKLHSSSSAGAFSKARLGLKDHIPLQSRFRIQ